MSNENPAKQTLQDVRLAKKAHSRMVRARVQMLLKTPFFGCLSTYLKLKAAQLPSYSGGMGTDGDYLYFQPDKIMNLPDEQLEGIIAHEVGHNALGHLFRRESRVPFRWNLATDFAANAIIHNLFRLPPGALYREDYKNKCAEEIYNLLPGPTCPKCGSKNIRGLKYKSTAVGSENYRVEARMKCDACGHEWTEEHTGTAGDIASGVPMPFDEVEGDFPSTLDDHSRWENNHNGKGAASSAKRRAERLAQQWKGRVIRAAQVAKSQGKIPAGIERLVDGLLYPKLGWRQLLWRYTSSLHGGRLNWNRPNRRYLRLGIYYPSRRERKLEAAVAIDTSGSIGAEELQEFLSELRGILSSFKSFRVRMLACDAAVHADVTATSLEDFDRFKTQIKGYGGTDFRPVFEALAHNNVQVLAYLTDCYGTFPDARPPYDVIWVVSAQGDPKRPPWGRIVQLEAGSP